MANRLFSLFAPFLWGMEQAKVARFKGIIIYGSDDDLPYAVGSGLELRGGTSTGMIRGYDRTGAGVYLPITLDGANVEARVSGNARLRVIANGIEVLGGSARLASFTVSTLPSASTHGAGAMIYVSNESGGAVPAFSDGTNWRRVTDRNIVS